MKKKSLFNGVRAKTTLAIVALSSALFTGCYKDGGLDITDISLPDATYTITGQVVDAETLSPIASASVSGDANATVTNGSFTATVSTPKTYSLSVSASGYDATTVSVNVEKANAGQSVVYPVFVALQPQYNGQYTLVFDVRNSEGTLLNASDYTTTITQAGQTATVANGSLKGGNTYIVAITATGYVPQYITVELPKVKANTEKYLTVTLSKEAVGNVIIYGDVEIGGVAFDARKIVLTDESGNVLGLGSGYAYRFEVSEDLFTEVSATKAAATSKSATFNLAITDNEGITFSFNKTYTISNTESSTGNKEVSADVNVLATVDEATETVDIASDVKTINAENDEESAVTLTYKYYPYEGQEVDKAAFEAVTVPANFKAIVESALFANETSDLAVSTTQDTNETYQIPAQTLLVSLKVTHVGIQVKRTLSGFAVDGNEVEIAALSDVIGKASTTITTATGEITLTDPVTQSISHGHGHGHGSDNNAGGGIIYSE